MQVRKATIPVLWTGALIPYQMWEDICAFFRQSFKRVDSESLCWLYYSLDKKEWAWIVPWQSTIGMSVKVEKDERNAKLREHLDATFIQIGSIHDHCNGSAFQSGTDKDDETNFDGIHITLGKLKEKDLDTDTRVCVDGIQYKSKLGFWIERPPEMQIIPPDLRGDVFDKMLPRCGKLSKTPEEILNRVQKRVYANEVYGGTDFDDHRFPPAASTTYIPAPNSPWRLNEIFPVVQLEEAGIVAFIDQNDNVWVQCSAGFRDSRYISSMKDWYARAVPHNAKDFNIIQLELIGMLQDMDSEQLQANGATFPAAPMDKTNSAESDPKSDAAAM